MDAERCAGVSARRRGRSIAHDPYAHLKDNSWREIAALDEQLERGAIDEQSWHDGLAAMVVPAYLAAETPWGQSGKSGDAKAWKYARSLVVDALDRDGTFLDVGCANGFLMESVVLWSDVAIEPYGLDIAPALVALARHRLPRWADRIWAGNALTWTPPRRFTYVRTGLEYVPAGRRRELVDRLLGWCNRLVVGVYNEHESEHTTEELLRSWEYEIAGESVRPNPRKPGMEYRCVWIDAP